VTPDEFIAKLKEAKAVPHLKNIWTKYQKNLMTYSDEDKQRVIKVKEEMKQCLQTQ